MANPNNKRIDLTGQTFGLLTVLKESEPRYGLTGLDKIRNRRYPMARRRWDCKCECGNLCTINQSSLTTAHTRSCGCLHLKGLQQMITKHGQSKHPIYKVWKSMRTRCNNPNDTAYRHYGGRGIQVCDRWESFENFLEDMGDRPSPSHSIDRIDVNGHYEPSNCRWATPKEQGVNKRNNRWITHNGETLTITQWARKLNLSLTTLYDRFYKQLPLDQILVPKIPK